MDERPMVNIVGERVALGPLRRELLPLYGRWHNDLATARTYILVQPTTREQEEAAFAAMSGMTDTVFFTVYERASWQPVGTTYLTAIKHERGTAEFGVLIGEVSSRGRGFGTETTRLMLDYAFTVLGLQNVMLTVTAFNAAGLRAYEKGGFREFGRRRACRRLAGAWWDEVYMDCIAGEFASPVLAKLLAPDAVREPEAS